MCLRYGFDCSEETSQLKSKLWMTVFIWLIPNKSLRFIIKGEQTMKSNKADSHRQKLVQRPSRGSVYWLASHGMLNPHCYRSMTNSLGMTPLIMGWALSHGLLNEKNILHMVLTESVPQLRLLPQITPTCVKFRHKTKQYKWPLVSLTHKHITIKLHSLLAYSSPWLHIEIINNFKSHTVFTKAVFIISSL